MLSACCLVITKEDKIEFKKEGSDRERYIALTPEFSVNSSETKTIVDYQTAYLLSTSL